MKDLHNNISFNESIDVACITLDDWAEANNIERIDFLWLDLQGVEPLVFQASPKVLENVEVIFTEISLIPLYKDSILYPEFKEWLKSRGFELKREDMPWIHGGDVLFVRKK